jgi:hypothetical protein
MNVMRTMMSKLKLTVNEQKTRFCRLPEESFDFLGRSSCVSGGYNPEFAATLFTESTYTR